MEVVLEHVTKVHTNQVTAVDDLNLTVADGELVVLVGPSGCGKTTTLRLIAGLETATAGTIRIGPRAVNDLPPKDRDVAMVFQNPALYPHLTVFQNLAFALRMRGTPRREIETIVRRVADLLGIGQLLDRQPCELSGGERQRVAVGRAIVRPARCFLFDEPLSSLDPGLRTEMRGELRRLHRDLEATTLYVTHDQEEAMTLGSRVVVMRAGRLQQVGSPLEIYQEPANRFVAGFFGSPPMNFWEGTLARDKGRLVLDDGSLRLPLPEWTASELAGARGRRLTLGIRAEDLQLQPLKTASAVELTASVVDVETLGDRTHVRLAVGTQPLVARWGNHLGLTPGTTTKVYADLAQAHVFDADGVALSRGRSFS
jgi:multiple sugar transport system ATP-binding protein